MNIIFNENNIKKSSCSPLLIVEQHIEPANNKILTVDDKKFLLANEEKHILKLV